MDDIQKIIDLVPATTYHIDGITYTDKQLKMLPHYTANRNPDKLEVTTLSSLLRLLETELVSILKDHDTVFIQIVSPNKVVVTTDFRDTDIMLDKITELPYGQRSFLYQATGNKLSIQLNSQMTYERMIIQLNAMFQKTDERDELLRLISNIDRSDSASVVDNGVSQTVSKKTGVALKENATIKPIWHLKPYRTFIEAEQATVPFLLRVDAQFNIGLYECDGGKWEIDAMQNIAKYFVAGITENKESIIYGAYDNGQLVVIC